MRFSLSSSFSDHEKKSLQVGTQWHQLKDFNIHKVDAFFSFIEKCED